MASIGDIWLGLRGDGSPLLKDAQKQGAKAGEVASKSFLGKMKSGLSNAKGGILAGLGLGAGFGAFQAAEKAIGAVTDAIFGSIDATSDLQESMSKNEAVFKDSSDEMEAWADTAAESFGQSKRQALEAAGTFGNLIQAFGIGADEAAGMSKAMTELASDLASFNNTSVDEAILALRSGLSGETEPLKRYGIALNDARLKEEALRLGLIKTTKGVLPIAIKTQAAYSLILKDSALAQGDFERTSDGLANSQKTLTAQMEDLAAEFGEVLIPVMIELATVAKDDVMPALSGILDLLKQLDTDLPVVNASFADLHGALLELQNPAARSTDLLTSMYDILEDLGIETEETRRGFRDFGIQVGESADEQRESAEASREAKRGLGVLEASTVTAGEETDTFREKVRLAKVGVEKMTDALRDHAQVLRGELTEAMTAYYDIADERRRLNEIQEEQSQIRRDARGRKFTDDERSRLNELEREYQETLAGVASKGEATMEQATEAFNYWSTKAASASGRAKREAEAARRAWMLVRLSILQASRAFDAFGDRGPAGGSAGRPGAGRAAGGPVSTGRVYTVGERGREWFVPSTDGVIIPNHTVQAIEQGGSAGGNTYQVQVQGALPVRQIDAIPRALRRAERTGIIPSRLAAPQYRIPAGE